MKIAFAWLREMVDCGSDPAPVGAALTAAGLALDGIEGAGAEAVLDLAVTTNRPDWLSHFGVARELAAITGAALHPPAAGAFSESASAPPLRVVIEAADGCGLYLARAFANVRVAPAPPEISHRLERLGHRSINNVADLTNYTLQEIGHPTHAFDADRIEGGEIRVRYARAGETLVTLDEVERRLAPEDLVIADARRPIALAGVLGGLHSAISPATRRVVLESAWFHPQAVRRTAKRHGLRTEASFRFERGVDPATAALACDLIAVRMAALGAEVLAGPLDARGALPQRRPLRLRPATLERLLGIAIPAAEVARILSRLGLQPAGEPGLWLPPTWRTDLAQEADLVEEVARLCGYDRFPARLPAFSGWAARDPDREIRERVRQQMRGHGYAEALSVSFASESDCQAFAPEAAPVRVLNPLSADAAILRTTALPAMAQLLRNNLNRYEPNPRLFEIAKRYDVASGQPRERLVLALGAAGAWGDRPYDWFDLKGELEALFATFAVGAPRWTPDAGPGFHPAQSALVTSGDLVLARAGRIAEEPVWLAEVDLALLLQAGLRPVDFVPPSRFPVSDRDFSFLFSDSVTWSAIDAALREPPIAGLAAFSPAEVYRGKGIEPGCYSLLVRARFQLPDRTLREEELQAAAAEIVRRLTALGGSQR